MIKIVLDTNVIVAGLLGQQGASHQLLKLIPSWQFVNVISVPLFLEYESVLKRSHLIEQHGLTSSEIDVLLGVWANYCQPVRLHYLWRPQLRDPQDEMVLETAVNGMARGIVTFNVKDFSPAIDRFNLKLYTPPQFLNLLRSQT
jgi:putative PIN family toxin of toxin-antitoxin system